MKTNVQKLKFGGISILIVVSMIASMMVVALPFASASWHEPTITVTDADGTTFTNTETGPLVTYRNETNVTQPLATISGRFYYENLKVEKPVDIDVTINLRWLDPNGTILSSATITNATFTEDIESSGTWYNYMSGHVDYYGNISSFTFIPLGEYTLSIRGFVYDAKNPSSSENMYRYQDELYINNLDPDGEGATYPLTNSFFIITDNGLIFRSGNTYQLNATDTIVNLTGGLTYPSLTIYLHNTPSDSIKYTWSKPDGTSETDTLSLDHQYDITKNESSYWTIKGGATFLTDPGLEFDGGNGKYTLSVSGRIYDPLAWDGDGHYYTYSMSLNINYIGDVGPIVDDIGSPIILQAMAATGGLMIVLGIMAAVWLWRHSDPFLAICCSVLMPLIGAGVLQAALG